MEILHVVLLGFIKYLWRDLISNQLKNNDAKKELLITRLSSLDVSGLGISPLAGKTLVKYSGSLTGRDFRSIAQVAPFVIYDLVPTVCFETWQALSKLVPLIWQPEILDLETHLVSRIYRIYSVKKSRMFPLDTVDTGDRPVPPLCCTLDAPVV